MKTRITISLPLLLGLVLSIGGCDAGAVDSVVDPGCDNGSTSDADCEVLCTTELIVTGIHTPEGGTPIPDDCGPRGTWALEVTVDAASDECAAQGLAVPIEATYTFNVRAAIPPDEREGTEVIELVTPGMPEWEQQFSITESGNNKCNGKFAFYNLENFTEHLLLNPFLEPGQTTLEGFGYFEHYATAQSW